MDDDTALECIFTIAATYGCKSLQLYECEVKECRYETKLE